MDRLLAPIALYPDALLAQMLQCAQNPGKVAALNEWLVSNKSLTGIFLGAELVLNHGRVHPMIQRHLDDVARGALKIVVDRTFPLSDAAAAHALIESRQAFGRVVLIP